MTGEAYQDLEKRFSRLSLLAEAGGFLHWDRATLMPEGAAASRADQLAEIAAIGHGLLTAPEVGDLLDTADGDADRLNAWQRANLAEMRRRWIHATALDEDLVVALSKAASVCEAAWRQARPENDFAAVAPYLAELLTIVRASADAKADRLGLGRYDALLDEYESGFRSKEIDRLFANLEAFLPGFLAEVMDHQATLPSIIEPEGPFPIPTQRKLGVEFMERLGFDFDHGRLDVSAHPFCGGTPDDVRITTRYDEEDFASALMGVLHETGHALYERGLPATWRRQPVGDALGMAAHESQSLLVEMQVCRSRAFIAFAAPRIRAAFAGSGPAWDAGNLHRLYTRVEPGFIRVDADEVTYPLHVILRYRLETALIEGDLEVADLPGAWNEGMAGLLGITPPNDRLGCLQDIHWYDGAWGYFPTYTLGALMAAQFFDAARRADGAVTRGIETGDFAPLRHWLGTQIHGQGRLLPVKELLGQVTGRPLDPTIFEAHLRRRYLSAGN